MPRPNRQLLPDIAALPEIDAAHVIQIAFQREGGGVVDLGLPLGDAVQDAAEGVGC